MAKTWSLVFTGDNDEEPIAGGLTRKHLKNAENYIRGVIGGSRRGSVGVAAQTALVAATGTVTLAAAQSGDTVTINGTALTATQHYATGTVTAASVSVADTVTVNGVVFTAAAAENLVTGAFNQASTDTAAATSLAACINASVDPLVFGIVTATSASAIVTIRAVASGTGGNALTLATSNNTRLAKSGTTLANGAAISNNQFDFTGTNTQNATALATAIGASTTAIISKNVSAAGALAVVTLTARVPGHGGNCITLASSNGGRLAVTGARLTGGSATIVTSASY